LLHFKLEYAKNMNPSNLIILDRDGTINQERNDFVKTVDEWIPLPGALEAIARLNQSGWKTVIATNQSGLARGLFDMATLSAMHTKMNIALAKLGGRIDAIFFCPHGPDQGCDCRKPAPGLLLDIGQRFHADLSTVPVVGDSLRDLQAAIAAGCPSHLVRTGRGQMTEHDMLEKKAPGTIVHDDLAAFAEYLISQQRAEFGTQGTDSGFGRFD
jgi:D-glycero-D-manno-heptose 1,7-bisphosphate phosphatase